ncbi:MAG: pullulanase [Limnochordales bacterium]|nr:pullulanase [Limnochordales bacterium]
MRSLLVKRVAFALVLCGGLLWASVVPVNAAPSIIFTAVDPAGDDNGPGTYVYPTNPVFTPGAFDLLELQVIDAGENVEFRIKVNQTISNPWGGPNGFSVQMFQIYVDTDHQEGSGFVDAIPGANVSFAEAEAWDRAIIVEGGWGDEAERAAESNMFEDMLAAVLISHSARVEGDTVIVPVPKSFLGEPQPGWGYQVLLLGQEGSTSDMDGVKVRRVLKSNTEWKFGGSDESGLHPNVIDMFVPANSARTQAEILKAYDIDNGLYAVVPMLYS